jgi:hypothetical protein
MCKYLSSTYPEEWEKLSENSMGETKGSVTNANLSTSLKSGFFATISDDKVVRFLKVRKLVMYLMGSIAILQLIMAYIL